MSASLRTENERLRTLRETAIADWFAAHDAYHKAADTYNARVRFVQTERSRDNFALSRDNFALAMTCDQEYKWFNETQRTASLADETLYQILAQSTSARG